MTATRGKTNATPGTKQVWVNKDMHQVIVGLAEEKKQTMRVVAEDLILKGLGCSSMSDLRARFEVQTEADEQAT